MNAGLCFSSRLDSDDDIGVVHLYDRDAPEQTLCGKPPLLSWSNPQTLAGRRQVTCEECKRRKPTTLGGGA